MGENLLCKNTLLSFLKISPLKYLVFNWFLTLMTTKMNPNMSPTCMFFLFFKCSEYTVCLGDVYLSKVPKLDDACSSPPHLFTCGHTGRELGAGGALTAMCHTISHKYATHLGWRHIISSHKPISSENVIPLSSQPVPGHRKPGPECWEESD